MQGMTDLEFATAKAVMDGTKFADVERVILPIISSCGLSESEARISIEAGWNSAAIKKSVDHPITLEEYGALADFYNDSGLETEKHSKFGVAINSSMTKTPGLKQMLRSRKLWEVLYGSVDPDDVFVDFILQSGELAVDQLFDVHLKEERTKRAYVGGYRGISVPIGRLGYLNVGASQGHVVESTSMECVDRGELLITTQNVYFAGRSSLQIRLREILRLQAYSDGIGIYLTSGNEHIFSEVRTDSSVRAPSGWYLFNLIHALAAKERMPAFSHAAAMNVPAVLGPPQQVNTPSRFYTRQPADRSLAAYKQWIREIAASVGGNTSAEDPIKDSPDAWERDWRDFWRRFDEISNRPHS